MLELNAFATEMRRLLTKDGNLFFSPFGIASALAMVHSGARGETARLLSEALHLPEDVAAAATAFREEMTRLATPDDDEGRRFRMSIANALFARAGYAFRPEFVARLREAFEAEAKTLDFSEPTSAAEQVNAWVAAKTAQRIKSIVKPEDFGEEVVCALVNAAHFLAAWECPFEQSATSPERFHGEGGDEYDVTMMRGQIGARWMRDDALGFAAARIPYHGAHMLVILPDTGRLRDVEKAFDDALLQRIDGSLSYTEIDLGLPRFEMKASIDLREALQRLGLDLFASPDLGGMADEPLGLVVSRVLHEARLRVDEVGTEASAATVVMVAMTGAVPETSTVPIDFTVDRPFLLVIRDDAGKIPLFLGRVVDPRA